MDRWLALGIFLLGAGSGALLTRIAQRGLLERHSLLAAENSRLGGHAFIALAGSPLRDDIRNPPFEQT